MAEWMREQLDAHIETARAGEQLLPAVRERVAADAMPPAAAASTVVLAALGDVVCVVGAGAVAFDRLDQLAGAGVSQKGGHRG